jgi:phage terminase large subunit-like protein
VLSPEEKLRAFISDPAAFREDLVIDGARGRARFGEVMAPFQRADFAAIDPALVALARGREPERKRTWWERTKGASKDSDAATCVLWLLAFGGRALEMQIGAADRDQAGEVLKIIKSLLRCNSWLKQLVEVQSNVIISKRTESRCEIIPADVAGSHGARPDVLILNELSHVQKEEFAMNLLDNASKVPHGLVIIATNAGFVPSFQYDLREMARTSERWYFSAFKETAPWLDPAELEEARKRNSAQRYARLWRGEWVSGSGDALDAADVAAAITQAGPMEGSVPGYAFFAGLDIGLAKDATALVTIGLHIGHTEQIKGREPTYLEKVHMQMGLEAPLECRPDFKHHPGTNRLRLADVRLWRPGPGHRVDLEAVERAIIDVHQRFRLACVAADPWQAEYLGTRLRKAFIPVEPVPFVPSALMGMATAVLDLFGNRQIDLYPDEQLLADLRALRLEEKGYGVRLASPKGPSGHGDSATGLALALHASRAFRNYIPAAVPGDRSLVWWPSKERLAELAEEERELAEESRW